MLERSDGVDILVTATLRDSPFQLSVQNRAMPPLEAAMRDARASGHGVTIVGSGVLRHAAAARSEEHTSELQSLMRISYAVFCLKKKKQKPEQQLQRRNHETQK